jgi:hypothetical protein
MRLSSSSLTGCTYTVSPSSLPLTLTGLPATSVDPTIADLGTGSMTLTYSSGSGIAFSRGRAVAPFSANIALSQNVIDQDGVTANNPVTFNGSGSGIFWSISSNLIYGRLALRNVLGSELLDLPVQLTTQYLTQFDIPRLSTRDLLGKFRPDVKGRRSIQSRNRSLSASPP